MASVENVSAVKFDCRVATVTMKNDTVLAKDAAEKALKDAGFGLKQFESGAGLTVAMLLMLADGFKPDQRELVTAAVMEGVKDIAVASISDGGEMVLLMRDGGQASAEAINAALEPVALKVKDVETSTVSVGYQRYSVEVSSVGDAAKTRKAIAAVDGVLAVTLTAAERRLDVITPEPCSNLEAKLGKALEPLGAKITKLEAL